MTHKFFFTGIILLWVLSCCPELTAQPVPAENYPRHIWADGNEAGVYMVLNRVRDDQDGFQIFYREKTGDFFKPGQWYPGQPLDVLATGERLLVFLSGGGSQSYDLQSSKTERALPTDLRIACSGYANGMVYAVARAQRPIELPYREADTPAAIEEEQETENASAPAEPDGVEENVEIDTEPSVIRFSQGQYVLLKRDAVSDWSLVMDQSVPIDWNTRHIDMAVIDGAVHIFWLSQGRLATVAVVDGGASEVSVVTEMSIEYVRALLVNREPLVVIGTDAEVLSAARNSIYLLGRRNQQEWAFGDPLRQSSTQLLKQSPYHTSFAPYGQNVGAFVWRSDSAVLFGQYDHLGVLQGEGYQPITAIRQNMMTYVRWLFGPRLSTALIMILVILIIWRRREMVVDVRLPEHVRPSPLWKRATAFAVDVIIVDVAAAIAIQPINHFLFDGILNPMTVLEQFQSGFMQPELAWAMIVYFLAFYVCYLLYFIIAEVYFRTTVGKRIMGLMIVSMDGREIGVRQLLLRNLFRAIEHYPHSMLLLTSAMIIMISNYQQRCGDIYARTMVVSATPELREKRGQWKPLPPKEEKEDESEEY